MSDLIRRKSIKNLLCDLHIDNISINGKHIFEFIDELPTVGEWIPCSERLPDTFEDTKSSDVVLVCGYDKEKDYHWKAMAFYVNTEALKRWFFAECKNTDKPIDWIDIVAWMPLPEDYKGD